MESRSAQYNKVSILAALFLLLPNLYQTSAQAQDDPYEPDPARLRNLRQEQPEKKPEPTKAAPKGQNFQLGNLSESSAIPGTFGPFSSRSSGVGIYRGRLKVDAADLKENQYLVIRLQNDKDHRFGWIRGFVGNQLVANESMIKDNRIVQDVSRCLAQGDSVVTVMGSAYPGTNVDFYVVPKETVVKVLQGEPLGKIVYSSGGMSASGKNPEQFEKFFDLAELDEKSPARFILTVKAVNSATNKPFSWMRVSLNGRPVLSEQNFLAGEGSLDVSSLLKKGQNKIEIQAASAPNSVYGCFINKLSKIGSGKAATATALAKPSQGSGKIAVSKLSEAKTLKAGETLEIGGKGFQSAGAELRVYFDDKFCTAKVSDDSSLKIEVPKTLASGKYRLLVCAGDERLEAGSLTVFGVPKLEGTNPGEVRPGKELEIKGENFSENRNEIQVELAGQALRVLTSSKQHIIVMIPELNQAANEFSLKVSVAGVPASNQLNLRLSN